MRNRLIVLIATVAASVAMTAPALAMQPPGEAAQRHFGCVDGEDNAVAGHPGAAGIVDATARVANLTGDSMPTAWNAVEHAEPIVLGSC